MTTTQATEAPQTVLIEITRPTGYTFQERFYGPQSRRDAWAHIVKYEARGDRVRVTQDTLPVLGITFHRVRNGSAAVHHWGSPVGIVVRNHGGTWAAAESDGSLIAAGLPTRRTAAEVVARASMGLRP